MIQESTETAAYRDRLVNLSGAWWKRLVPVQAPYRFNVRRLCPGLTLEIGCGIGRNLGRSEEHTSELQSH